MRVALAFLGIACGFCQGFCVAPSAARGWRISGCSSITSSRGVGQRPRCCSRPTRMSVTDMIGADVESGGLFDPLGFSKDEPSLFRRRAVELKHGRVSMLAMVGILVQSFVRFPGFPPFPVSNAARPLAVLAGLWAAEAKAVLMVLFAIGVVEVTIGKQDYVDRAPGELGSFGSFAKPVDEEEWEKVQMAELKHGRLAMLAVAGCVAQEAVTGEGPVEQLLSGNVNPFA